MCPEWVYEHFPTLNQYVTRGEMVGALSGIYSKPDLFKGRRVIHFVDNAAALSGLVNGYANKADMARMVNLFHVALIALDIEWYGEWVPSLANVSDILTRDDRMHELEPGLRKIFGDNVAIEKVPFEFPPLASTVGELKEWMREMRKKGAE